MKLQEIFDQLAHGELAQIHFAGGNQEGEIPESAYPRLISYISTGLTALYTRFTLKEGNVKIELIEGLQEYPLKAKHNQSNPSSVVKNKFIDDSIYPFVGDVLGILEVTTDKGYRLPLNDGTYKESISTPTLDTLRVPLCLLDSDNQGLREELKTDSLLVKYRANHPNIVDDMGLYFPEDTEIELPYSHLQALLFYVASRVYSTNGMVEEGVQGSNFFAKYEHECRLLETANMRIQDETMNMRLINAGWV